MLGNLCVYPENMRRNLGISLGMWNSQTVLLALIKKGLTREQAYDLVQTSAMRTWAIKHAGCGDADFLGELRKDPDVAKHFKPGDALAGEPPLCCFQFCDLSRRIPAGRRGAGG